MSPLKNMFISLMMVVYLEVVAPMVTMNMTAKVMPRMHSEVLSRLRRRFRMHIVVIRVVLFSPLVMSNSAIGHYSSIA